MDLKEKKACFTMLCRDRTRGNSFKLEEDWLRSDIRKKSITARVLGHWERGCPGKLARLDKTSCHLVLEGDI